MCWTGNLQLQGQRVNKGPSHIYLYIWHCEWAMYQVYVPFKWPPLDARSQHKYVSRNMGVWNVYWACVCVCRRENMYSVKFNGISPTSWRPILSSELCWMYPIIHLLLHLQSVKYMRYRVDEKNQLDATFCILYFSSKSCSTGFGQPCAHHQELTTAWCYSLVLVCAVAAGRLSLFLF